MQCGMYDQFKRRWRPPGASASGFVQRTSVLVGSTEPTVLVLPMPCIQPCIRSGSNQQSVLFSVRIDARDSMATNWEFKVEWLAEPFSESSRNSIGRSWVAEHASCFSAWARGLFNVSHPYEIVRDLASGVRPLVILYRRSGASHAHSQTASFEG